MRCLDRLTRWEGGIPSYKNRIFKRHGSETTQVEGLECHLGVKFYREDMRIYGRVFNRGVKWSDFTKFTAGYVGGQPGREVRHGNQQGGSSQSPKDRKSVV